MAPGIIETDMNSQIGDEVIMNLKGDTPLMRLGSAKEIAHSIMFLASEEASFFTGQVLSPNGGYVV